MASLLVVSGSCSGDYYLLRHRAVVIGRDDTCPIQIVDDTVSRHHVEIRREDGDGPYRVRDMGSANGTQINDEPLETEQPLTDGDIIRIGTTELMFSAIDFADGETAFQHYRQRGEGTKSTIIRKKGTEGGRA